DLAPDECRPFLVRQDLRRHGAHRCREKAFRFRCVHQQRFHVASQRLVSFARGRHERRPFTRIAVERGVADLVDAPPVICLRHGSSPSSSRSSHSFARRQSRLTVSDETLSTSAVSSTVKPPKNRNSTTWLFRTSTCANASRAR